MSLMYASCISKNEGPNAGPFQPAIVIHGQLFVMRGETYEKDADAMKIAQATLDDLKVFTMQFLFDNGYGVLDAEKGDQGDGIGQALKQA